MQLLARIPDPGGQVRFHKTVNVLIFFRNRQRTAFHIFQNALKPLCYARPFLLRQNVLPDEHGGVCDAAFNILP